MSKLERASLTEQASRAIVELIEARGLRNGDSLPPTGELAVQFDVSVPVVREAIAGLVTIGLLKRRQGRESTVSTPDSTHLSRILALRASSADLNDESIQQFREIVEVGSARLAARNRDKNDLTELESALVVLRAATHPESLHQADVAFHAAVARASRNDLLILTLDALTPLLHRQRQRIWNGWATAGGDVRSIVEAHEVIQDAIRRQDESQAAAAMTAHLRQARVGLEAPALDDGTRPFRTG